MGKNFKILCSADAVCYTMTMEKWEVYVRGKENNLESVKNRSDSSSPSAPNEEENMAKI